ncbi:TlpA family protein disulfide reductase [Alteromonas sp. a30]|nr:TlpA family protein disulfide reductase [Alteromonas sp. a30]
MPEWELKTADGEVVKSTDLLGKPVILHFWATWCPYCKRLQPAFDRLNEKYKDQGLQIWAVSFSEKEGAKPQEMLNERGHTFKTLVDGDRVAIGQFQVNATPTTYFFYADGSMMGMTQSSDPENPGLDKAVEHMLAEMEKAQGDAMKEASAE